MTESLYPRISVYPCQPFHIHLPTVAKQQISGSVIILIPGNFPLSLPFSVLFRHIYFRTDGILLHHLQKRYHFSGLSSHNFSILQNFRFRNFYTVSHGQAAFPRPKRRKVRGAAWSVTEIQKPQKKQDNLSRIILTLRAKNAIVYGIMFIAFRR